jgi:FkbM family methyltransferase
MNSWWKLGDEMYVKEMIELHDVRPKGILHVGAHKAEELSEYLEQNFNNGEKIYWVEAIPKLAQELQDKLDPKLNTVINAVVWNVNDVEMEFNVSSKTASSSILEFGTHLQTYPDITVVEKIKVRTSRLDSILTKKDKFELIVFDIQGAELQAIQGAGELLESVKWIFTEVSKKQVYEGSALVGDLDQELKKLGFERVFTVWERSLGWGDALYARQGIHTPSFEQRLRSFGKWLNRFARWLVPQSLYPSLVKIKQSIKWQ